MRQPGSGVCVGALACVLACGSGPPRDETGEAIDRGAPPTAAGWQECRNEPAGVTIRFPAEWHTNDGTVMPACSLFDPQPFDVPVASEVPEDIAVAIHVENVDFETVAVATFALRVLERDERAVAGRPAVVRLVEHTGEALYERGMRSWQYLVDWGTGRTLIAESHSAGQPDFAVKRDALDGIVTRLRPD